MSENNELSSKLLLDPIHFLSLGFGAGFTPKLPGTAGTLVGVLIYLPVQSLQWPYYLGLVAVLFLSGIWLCGRTADALGLPDHPAIVWDEIIGYLLSMTLAPRGWGWIVLGFCLFRLFDIWKPWPIQWLDREVKGGAGIMLDDALAGLFSAMLIQIIAYLLKS
ncbi:MAG: phosphatidylglycerophosphatase A [Gammaproteobacteria bacterium]